MAQVLQVQVAAPSKEVATELARGAVEARLAAGSQVVGPVTSVFWHLGEFGTGEEWQVVLKTTEERYPELEKHLVGPGDHRDSDRRRPSSLPGLG
jgi:periplasmic divalent cation tolerance protein